MRVFFLRCFVFIHSIVWTVAEWISDCACDERVSHLLSKQISPFELLRMYIWLLIGIGGYIDDVNGKKQRAPNLLAELTGLEIINNKLNCEWRFKMRVWLCICHLHSPLQQLHELLFIPPVQACFQLKWLITLFILSLFLLYLFTIGICQFYLNLFNAVPLSSLCVGIPAKISKVFDTHFVVDGRNKKSETIMNF